MTNPKTSFDSPWKEVVVVETYLPEFITFFFPDAVAALPSNLGKPSMSLETATKGVKAALTAIVENQKYIKEASFSRWQI